MKEIMNNLSKASVTSLIAVLFILGLIILDTISMFHKPTDKDITILILTNIHSIAGFVAGYYFNKKTNGK